VNREQVGGLKRSGITLPRLWQSRLRDVSEQVLQVFQINPICGGVYITSTKCPVMLLTTIQKI
jgi:hypothetical protein